jgi:ABC-2 type transport system ATP-binding protein
VGSRTIRATLPDVPDAALLALPGVARVERRGAAVILRCGDADAAIRALLAAHPTASDLEISGAGLEEAFLELTGGEDDEEVAA